MATKKYGFHLSDGLDLNNVDTTTTEEKIAFLGAKIAQRRGKIMYPVTAYSFLFENRPDLLKYHFRQMQFLSSVPEDDPLGLPATTLTMLHWYTCNRVSEGILHEVMSSQRVGASKAQLNEVFGLAFMHSGPSGIGEAYEQVFDYMQSYQDPPNAIKWPKGWAPDPAAFVSGLDFDNPDFGPGEKERLFKWYEDAIGHVPSSVSRLTRINPRFMKAHRAKFEASMKTGALPKQMVPYILIHYNMNRGFREGIREATLLARTWGMRVEHVHAALTLGTGYMAGIDGLYIVEEAIGDLLDNWQ